MAVKGSHDNIVKALLGVRADVNMGAAVRACGYQLGGGAWRPCGSENAVWPSVGVIVSAGRCAVAMLCAGWDHSAVRRVLSWGHSDRESAGGSPGSEPQYSSTGKPLVSVVPQSCVKVYAVSWCIRD